MESLPIAGSSSSSPFCFYCSYVWINFFGLFCISYPKYIWLYSGKILARDSPSFSLLPMHNFINLNQACGGWVMHVPVGDSRIGNSQAVDLPTFLVFFLSYWVFFWMIYNNNKKTNFHSIFFLPFLQNAILKIIQVLCLWEVFPTASVVLYFRQVFFFICLFIIL